MGEKHPPEPGSPQPVASDLQEIVGIGPSLATRLTQAGVSNCRDLASLTAERIADLLGDVVGMSAERIASQDWIGQARRLIGDVPNDAKGHQRYATFHVDLLIDSDDRVRRTKVRHYQTDTEASWSGWDDERLIALIRTKAALGTPSAHAAEPRRPPPTPIQVDWLGPAEEGTRGAFRHAGQPTAVRMTLRVNPINGVEAKAVDFTAEVAARSVGSRGRHPLGSTKGIITVGQPMDLELKGPPLPPGMHDLEVVIALYGQDHQPDDKPLYRCRGLGGLMYVADEQIA